MVQKFATTIVATDAETSGGPSFLEYTNSMTPFCRAFIPTYVKLWLKGAKVAVPQLHISPWGHNGGRGQSLFEVTASKNNTPRVDKVKNVLKILSHQFRTAVSQKHKLSTTVAHIRFSPH